MNKLLLLLVVSPICLNAQESTPVKNNNTIIVKGVGFNKVKETLLDAGFFFDQQNPDDGTIITKRKGYCECPNKEFYQLIYYIRVKDSTVSIKGKFSQASQVKLFNDHPNTDDKDDFSDVVYWKTKNTSYNYLFGIMNGFAKSLNGSSIEYKTQ